jgi:hypothetical protein
MPRYSLFDTNVDTIYGVCEHEKCQCLSRNVRNVYLNST